MRLQKFCNSYRASRIAQLAETNGSRLARFTSKILIRPHGKRLMPSEPAEIHEVQLRHVLEPRGQGHSDAREGFISAVVKHRASVAITS
jgi:hypothetical protein